MSGEVTYTHEGDDLRIVVERIGWTAGSVRGEVNVYWHGQGIVQHQRLDCQSASQARELVTRLNKSNPDIAWHAHLEAATTAAVAHYRAVEGMVDARTIENPQRPAALVGDIWPDMSRACLMFGDSESAKSILATGLILAVASKAEVLPGEPVLKSGPVAFLDWEDDKSLFGWRLKALARGAGVNLDDANPVFYWSPPERRPLYQISEALSERIRREGIVAIVIDSRGAAQGGSLSGDEETNAFFTAIGALETRAQVIDHLDKATIRGDVKDVKHSFGSVYTRGRVASSWRVVGSENDQGPRKTVTLKDAKWNHGPRRDPRSYHIDFTEDRITISKTAGPVQTRIDDGPPATETVLAALREHPAGLTPRQIETETGINYNTVRSTLRRLTDRGDLVQHQDRFIHLIDPF